MPNFVNPFIGMEPGRLFRIDELIRAIRLAISAEEEAVHLYESIVEATNDPLSKAVFRSVADEERVHIGEFWDLLDRLVSGEEKKLMNRGAQEVSNLASSIK